MSATAPENQSTPDNPYLAPKSSPSLLAKNYLSLAINCALAVATVSMGLWLYEQSKKPIVAREGVAEDEVFMERGPPD